MGLLSSLTRLRESEREADAKAAALCRVACWWTRDGTKNWGAQGVPCMRLGWLLVVIKDGSQCLKQRHLLQNGGRQQSLHSAQRTGRQV